MSLRAEPPAHPSASESRWRCFVAVSLAEPARAAVVEYLERLRATVAGVAWTRSENLHLTLKFLGAVVPSRLPGLQDRLRVAVAGESAGTLEVAGVGAFPSLAHPQALWVGVRSRLLPSLASVVDAACEAEGFPGERRPFRPHVTLGRVRSRRRGSAPDLTFLARDGGREFGTAAVTSIVLFRSELAASGARHDALAAFPLVDGGKRFA